MFFSLSLKLSPMSLTVVRYSQVWTHVYQERALILELILYACKIKKNKNHCPSWKLFFFFTKLLNHFCNIRHKFRKVTTTADFTTTTTTISGYTTRSPETTTTYSPQTTTTQCITTMTATTDFKTEFSTMTGIFY